MINLLIWIEQVEGIGWLVYVNNLINAKCRAFSVELHRLKSVDMIISVTLF